MDDKTPFETDPDFQCRVPSHKITWMMTKNKVYPKLNINVPFRKCARRLHVKSKRPKIKKAERLVMQMNPTNESLANSHGCWERCDARSGGLQEWALLEICAENFLTATARPMDQRPVKVAVLPAVVTPLQTAAGPKTGPARQRLTHEEAVAIYLARLGPKSCKTAARMAAEFGITAKAVRDVWTGKTWAEQTRCVRTVQRANDYIPPSASSAVAVARVQRALSRVHPPKRVACQ